MKRKLKTRRDTNRAIIVRLLKKAPDWMTFKEIKARTGLNIREVMDITGHEPYDIIGTRYGYKHISRATNAEIREARSYLHHKIYAMRVRSEGIQSRYDSMTETFFQIRF